MSKDIIAHSIGKSKSFQKLIAESKYLKEDIAEYYATNNNIEKCRNICREKYPFERIFKSSTLNINALGSTKKLPGESCTDIQLNGPIDNHNTFYYININGKVTKVYCNNNIPGDDGGWMKVYN